MIWRVNARCPKPFRWVYLLPLIHFCACLTSMVGLIVPQLQTGDRVEFHNAGGSPDFTCRVCMAKYSALADLWILVAGTLWWYLLSRGAELVFDKFKGS